jgi:hypothetical protein
MFPLACATIWERYSASDSRGSLLILRRAIGAHGRNLMIPSKRGARGPSFDFPLALCRVGCVRVADSRQLTDFSQLRRQRSALHQRQRTISMVPRRMKEPAALKDHAMIGRIGVRLAFRWLGHM